MRHLPDACATVEAKAHRRRLRRCKILELGLTSRQGTSDNVFLCSTFTEDAFVPLVVVQCVAAERLKTFRQGGVKLL